MIEDHDYQLIPADTDNEQGWDIRILTGDFIETVIRFGNIAIDGNNDSIKFNFAVIQSPDDEATVDNDNLQEVAGKILGDVLDRHFESGHMVLDDR